MKDLRGKVAVVTGGALTHPDWYPMVEQRHEGIAAALRRAAAEG
jgi:hypothetical protein